MEINTFINAPESSYHTFTSFTNLKTVLKDEQLLTFITMKAKEYVILTVYACQEVLIGQALLDY